MDHRYKRVTWGPHGERQRTKTWGDPIRWNRKAAEFAAQHGRRQRVFSASLSDVWDNAVPIEWQRDLLQLISVTPDLDWLLLTKRPQNIIKTIQRAIAAPPGPGIDIAYWASEWLAGRPPANVWLGISTENQTEADRRIPVLLDVPARVRFLSCEPLLGPLDLMPWLTAHHIHWVIVGGESGKHARDMPVEWAQDIRAQCQQTGVAFLMKQLSEASRPRDFRVFDSFPPDLQVHQWPVPS
jgi:protein gp37